MAWTEESIKAEFETHLAYWKQKLRMMDLDIRIVFVTKAGPEWCAIRADNADSNPHMAVIEIARGSYDTDITRYDVWQTVAHELVHAMNWSMSRAFIPLDDHFAVAQMNMAKALMRGGNESLAYKWDGLLSEWFKTDAPTKEIP